MALLLWSCLLGFIIWNAVLPTQASTGPNHDREKVDVIRDPKKEDWDVQLIHGVAVNIDKIERNREKDAERQRHNPSHDSSKEAELLDQEEKEMGEHGKEQRENTEHLIDVLNGNRRNPRSANLEDLDLGLNEVPPGRLQYPSNQAPNHRQKRLVVRGDSKKWTNGIIPYKFDSATTTNVMEDEVRHQMLDWEYRTMFRFVPWTATTRADYNLDHDGYALFKIGSGCYSYVGNLRGPQSLSCCSGSTCRHELGHLLGLAHEMSSYLRDDYLRINLHEVNPASQANFYKKSAADYEAFGYVDLASVMQYGFWDFHVNSQKVIDYLDPELEVLNNLRHNLFYEAFELQQSHDILTTNCSGFTATCDDVGYVSYTDDQCQCMCPEGLNASSNCASVIQTESNAQAWPAGYYGTLKTMSGCPSNDFSGDGYVQYTGYGSSGISVKYSASPDSLPGTQTVKNEFCVLTNGAGGGTSWDKGNYCVLKGQGDCPADFTEGEVAFDADGTQTSKGGSLPSGTFSGDPVFKFCCRNDGYYGRPISLPTTQPFTLFPRRHDECQAVKGMASRLEFFEFTNQIKTNPDYGVSGLAPYVYYSDSKAYVYYCYYYHVNRDCGGVVSLGTGGSYTLESPNFPSSDYNNAQYCVWFIKSPVNTQLKLAFDSFDIATLPDGDCDDTLEIVHTLPGNIGARYCGEQFTKTIISDLNVLSLQFRSDDSNTTRAGFNGTVTVISESDVCYKNNGLMGAYSGTRNFSRSYKSCLPWSEVTHCNHNKFENTDFEDSLDSNYCRNPGNGLRPWCYVEADTCIRDYCDVCNFDECRDIHEDCEITTDDVGAFCIQNALECKKTCSYCDCYSNLSPYTGTAFMTATNRTCQSWHKNNPHSHNYHSDSAYPDATVEDASNYCRSPDGWSSLWCYTTDPHHRWDICNVPHCNDNVAILACVDTASSCEPDPLDACAVDQVNDHLRCSKTCGSCPSAEPSATSCDPPAAIPTTTKTPVKSTYDLGDVVTFTCTGNSMETKQQVCSTEISTGSKGVWKPELQYVCGACPMGWTSRGTKCLKHFDDQMSKAAAESFCTNLGAKLVTDRSDAEKTAIERERALPGYGIDGTWLGASVGSTSFEWHDGQAIQNNHRIDGHNMSCISSSSAYVGTKSNTINNQQCQRWDSNTPHTNNYMTSSYPDGTAAAAGNNCRDPGGDGYLWCYTTDPSVSWDYCGVPVCNTQINCLYLTDDGYWSVEACSKLLGVICEYAPARSVCVDQASDCDSTFEATPDVCTRFPDYCEDRCARSGGRCTDSNPNAVNTDVSCNDPGSSGFFSKVTGGASVNVGEVFEYQCNSGYALSAGNLKRMCKLDGTLTGQAPTCTGIADVDLWASDVSTRSRYYASAGQAVYFSENGGNTITKPGKVKAWKFYSMSPGWIALQVWRHTGTNGYYQLIGQNVHMALSDREMYIEVDPSDQISVQANDLVGFLYGNSGNLGPAYDKCLDGSGLSQFWSYDWLELSDVYVGETYSFLTRQDCLVFSFNALVGP